MRLLLIYLFCGSWLLGQTIESGYDPEFPLNQIRTFAFMQQERESPDGLVDDPAAEARLRECIDDQLNEAGLEAARESPDVLVAFYAKDYFKTHVRGIGYEQFGNVIDTTPEAIEMAILTVDLVSVKTKKGVWRGTATAKIKTETLDRDLARVCGKLAKRFLRDSQRQRKARR